MKLSRQPTTTISSPTEDLFRSISLPGERWKHAKGFSSNYFVSDMGRLLTLTHHGGKHPAIMKPAKDGSGYWRTAMDGKTVKVHRIVAENWLSNPLGLPCVNHLNSDRSDNSVANLEWCSVKYNAWYGVHHGRVKTARHPRQDLLTKEERTNIVQLLKEQVSKLSKDKNGKFFPKKGEPTTKDIFAELCKKFPNLAKIKYRTCGAWLWESRSRYESMRQSLTIQSECERHHTHIVLEDGIVFPCTTPEKRTLPPRR